MPIPLTQLDEASERRASLRLVKSVALEGSSALLYPRVIAHFVDFCVVEGLSLYAAKLFSVVLVSFHAGAIGGTGRAAVPIFREAFAYSSVQLLAGAFAAIGLLYFVALPLVTGRTLGLGLLGLRIRGDDGEAPKMRQLALRLFGCLMTYATGGLLCFAGLRQRDGRFFQDVLSGTRITKE